MSLNIRHWSRIVVVILCFANSNIFAQTNANPLLSNFLPDSYTLLETNEIDETSDIDNHSILTGFNVDFSASNICANHTEWLVPIDVGAVPSSIGAVSLVLDFDNTKLDYQSIHSSHSSLSGAPIQLSESNGKIYISWTSLTTATISNTTLMTLKFVPANSATDFSAIAGSSTAFSWDTSTPGNCEFADGNGVVIPATFNNQTGATANPLSPFTFTSNQPNNIICGGGDITFTATGGVSYDFYKNNSTTPTLTNTTGIYAATGVNSGDVFSVVVTDANGCIQSSNNVTVGVFAPPTAGLSADKSTICPGETVTFTATGGVSYVFDDGVNANIAGTGTNGDQFVTNSLTNGQVVTVTITDANGCTATHAGLTTNVLTAATINITSDDPNNEICIGDNITLTASGGISYTFEVNNSGNPIVGTGTNGDEFSTNSLPLGNNTIKVVGTGTNTCINEATINIVVHDLPIISLASDKTNDVICDGELMTFTGTGAGTGAYQFFLNNNTVTGTGNQYASTNLQNQDKVKVEGTDGNGCINLSSEITVTVNPLPLTAIDSDDSDDRICIGLPIVYTATKADEFTFYSTVNNVTTEIQAQSATNTYNHLAAVIDGQIFSVVGIDTATGCESNLISDNPLDVDDCYTVSGKMVYKNSVETPMGNVVITINGPGVVNAQTTTAISDGAYSIPNLFDNETYTFSYTTTKPHGGANSTDAILTLYTAVGFPFISGGLNRKAADVNLNGFITAWDAFQIQWRFSIPFFNVYTGGVDWVYDKNNFTPSGGDLTGQKIQALCMGDVDGSYVPNSAARQLPKLNAIYDSPIVTNDGERMLIPIRIKQNADVAAMSLSMFYPSDVMTIHDIILDNDSSMIHGIQGNEIRGSWIDLNPQIFNTNDVAYYIDATIHDVAAYNAAPLSFNNESEFADGTGSVIEQVVLGIPTIQSPITTSANVIETAVENVRHYPNPFSNVINIEYDLPSTSQVQIEIFNAIGQKITELANDTQTQGQHRVRWNADNQAVGMYYYTITISDGMDIYKKTNHIVLVR